MNSLIGGVSTDDSELFASGVRQGGGAADSRSRRSPCRLAASLTVGALLTLCGCQAHFHLHIKDQHYHYTDAEQAMEQAGEVIVEVGAPDAN